MREIWSEQRKLEIWLQIELLASEALCAEGLVPTADFRRMKARAAFSVERCRELEREIADMETEIAGYETELANFVSPEETVRVSSLLDNRRTELRELLAEWEQVSHVVESQQA